MVACIFLQNNNTSKKNICVVMNAQLFFHYYFLWHRIRINEIQKISEKNVILIISLNFQMLSNYCIYLQLSDSESESDSF